MTGEPEQSAQNANALQCLTTEHFNLQTARSAAIAESNGRAGLFLSTVSSAVVAMSFIGQASKMGEAFFTFSMVLFPTLFFLGIVTFVRMLQTGIEDVLYARGINRIRHFYTEVAPEIKPYLVLSTHDDMTGALESMGLKPAHFQTLLTSSSMIAVINGVLAGVIVGIVMAGMLQMPLWLAVLAAALVFLVSGFFQYQYQAKKWAEADEHLKSMFPSGDGEK
jgi:hypothetical protein